MKKIFSKKITIILLALFSVILAFTASVFVYKETKNGTFPKNTFVNSIEISGLDFESAKTLLESKLSNINEISFSLNNQNKTLTLKDLGVSVLLEETLSQRSLFDSRSVSLMDFYFNEKTPVRLSLIYNIDGEKLVEKIEENFDLKGIHAENANFYFNENYGLEIKEENSGFKINEEKLYKDIGNTIDSLVNKEIKLELVEEEAILKLADLEELKPSIQEKLNSKLTLIDPVYSDNWYPRLIDFPKWVIFDSQSGEVLIKINQEELNKYIDEEISKWLDKASENVKIYKDENDEIVIEGKGADGMIVLREFFAREIENAVNNGNYEIEIPIKKTIPNLEISKELQDLGITDRVSVGHTSFYGSPSNRIHNIKVGADTFNGLLIAPGEEFSFNTNLGPVNAATGYKPELVIKADGTKPEYGGGLCQVSTTMYRTILFSGLPITDRRAHSYAVSYYSQIMGHGLDATIYLGGQDLKFTNDTDSHILVQAYTENDYELYIIFYGTDPGKVIEMEGPYLSNYHSPGATQYIETDTLAPGATKQVENRHVGFTALWYRYITDEDGNTTKEEITSYYKAIPAKVLVGRE